MALEKGFLHRKLQFSDIPLTRKFIGPFMGALFAIAFYALLYLLRDILRALPGYPPESFWELSVAELQFYNFFYAALASLLGQSVCVDIWLNRSRKIFSSSRLSRIRVVHDQRFFNWYFLAWFSKVAFVFWMLFGYAFWGGHYVFSLYPDYRFLFYLILVVMFLQIWTSFRQLFPGQSLQCFLVSAFTLSLFSFGLSQINFVDQQAFQYGKQQGSVYNKYDFELPRTAYYENIYHNSLALKIQVVIDSSKQHEPYSILIQGNQTTLDGLLKECQLFINNLWEAGRPQAFAQLYIDARVSIAFVEKIKTEIAEAGIRKLCYMVVPEKPEYDVRYYGNMGISEYISGYLYLTTDRDTISVDSLLSPSAISKNIGGNELSGKQLNINSSRLDQRELAKLLKLSLVKEPGKALRYYYNPQDHFSKYVRILSAAHLAMKDLKEEYAKKNYGKNFNELEWEQRSELDNRFSVDFQAAAKRK